MPTPRAPLATAIAAVALVVLASACGGGNDDSSTDADGGRAFTAEQLGGGELASSSFAGQDTVLWFWAPWCTTCRAEADDVVAAADALDGRVEVIGVAGRGEVPEMDGFVDDTGTGGLTHVVDAEGTIWSGYGVASQPAFAFIDDDGTVEVTIGALGVDALTERMTALAEA